MLVVYLLVLGFSAANPLNVSAESAPAPAAAPQAGILAGPVAEPLAYDQPPSGVSRTSSGLTITPITAYNLIVDSNVLSPSTYGPSAATLGAQFCNTSGAQLTNVWAYIGNFNPSSNVGAPGTYPIRNEGTDAKFASEHPTLVGATQSDNGTTFSLKHQSGSVNPATDASRFLGTLDPGQCRTQYWLVTYPRKALVGGSWVTVTGGIKPEDDLWLGYYFWASAAQTAAGGPSYEWRPLTMRNEISAMANKIWPNGDNKVPEAYRTAIADLVGWETLTPTGTSRVYPGQTVTSQGIWYDFGNVGAGFDNNFDFVPDRNAWVQPIGDASSYDPGCFRLVRTYGLVIVKLNDGSEMLVPFVDRMYFENIPDNNNGAVGLVYYEYIALDGACTAGLTPYQEVASGYDNEKFNGDFGAGVPPLQSREFSSGGFTFDKSGSSNVSLGGRISYSLKLSLPAEANTASQITIGNAAASMPLVFQENIPAGTQFVPGSVTSSLAADVLYSNDNGTTWTTTASTSATTIQWWLKSDVQQTASAVDVTVGFQVSVPAGPTPAAYARPTVDDTACLRLGSGPCFTEDTFTTLVDGPNSLNGYVYADTGAGGGAVGDGARNGAEPGIGDGADADTTGVRINLYLWNDANGNGIVDSGEVDITTPVRSAVDTDGTGYYSFSNLPDGRYAVIVDPTDADIPTGYAPTSATTLGAALDPNHLTTPGGVTVANLNFGFAPALSVTKTLVTPSPVYGGDTIQYRLNVSNTLPGSGASGSTCTYQIWAGSDAAGNLITPPDGWPINGTGTKGWQAQNDIDGRPDGRYSYTFLSDSDDYIALSGFNMGNQGGNITKVQLMVYAREMVDTKATDIMDLRAFYNSTANDNGLYDDPSNGSALYTYRITGADLVPGTLQSNQVILKTMYDAANPALTPTYQPAGGWTWAAFANNLTEFKVEGNKGSGGGSSGDFGVDAVAFIVTTDQACSSDTNVLNPVPLTDKFDNRYLTFVSAEPPVSQPPSAAGNDTTLTWANLGPLYAGQTKSVTVTFTAKQVSSSTSTINYDQASGAKFASGTAANDDLYAQTDNQAAVTISPTGSISGVTWADAAAPNGWSAGATGYNTGDTFIPGVTVSLYACEWDNGAGLITSSDPNYSAAATCAGQKNGGISGRWTLTALRTTTTDANGAYSFTGLRPGFYYVQISGLPAGFATQMAEALPNGTGQTCGTCNNLWEPTGAAGTYATAALTTTNFNELAAGENITNVNFGYSGSPVISGNVWQDYNADGLRAAADSGLGTVTVTLRNCGADATCGNGDDTTTTTTTNTAGYYQFTGLTAGRTYQVSVNTGTLPAGGAWSETAEARSGASDPIDNLVTQVSVLANTVYANNDFGFTQKASSFIGDTLYYDWDGSAAQNAANEEGIKNVTVSLYRDLDSDGVIDASEPLVATTVSNTNGLYCFIKAGTIAVGTDVTASATTCPAPAANSGLPSGNYIVQVDRGDADFPLATVAQTQDPNETGACVTCDSQSGSVAVSGANSNLAQDFGYRPVGGAVVGDTVFFDRNGNGYQDGAGETGLPNITVWLQVDLNGDGTWVTIKSASSDASGKYSFSGLPNGSYRVMVDTADPDMPKDAFGQRYVPASAPSVGGDWYSVTIAGGVVTSMVSPTNISSTTANGFGDDVENDPLYQDADFAFTALGAFGDTVYLDINGNGTQDYNEPGIAGVAVKLCTFTDAGTPPNGRYDPGETISASGCQTATTNASGKYLFSGLPAGTYVATVTPPVDSLTSNPMTLTGDPEADGVSCATSPEPYAGFYTICDQRSGMTLYPGTNYMGADFGYRASGVLGDTLWLDSNGNKVVDPGEKGLPGVTVSLTGGPSCTPTACTTTTDADGLYLFSGLQDGMYTLRIVKPAGLTNTAYPAGTLFDADSYISVQVTGGKVTMLGTQDCTLTTGGCDLDADFGFQYTGSSSLSGTICLDAINGDLTNDTFAADPTDQIGVCGADAQPGTSGVGAGEASLDNVIVHLYIWNDKANAGTIDAGELIEIATQATDAGGNYAFANIPDGVMYVVSANAPGSSLELTTQTGDSASVTAAENEKVVENNPGGPDTAAYAVVSLVTSTSAPNVDFAYTSTVQYDFGDLPDSYSTTLQSTPDGARSPLQNGLYLGNNAPDAEENGAATAAATGDGADEDGVTLQDTNWSDGSGAVAVKINGSGYLAGWIDFNKDGKFTPDEMVIGQNVTTNPAQVFPITVPAGTFSGPSTRLNARFRLFAGTPSFPALAYTGASSGGEVEDYQFTWGLAVDKDVVDPHTVAPSAATTYRIYVANTGDQPLSGITVNDTLPSGFSLTGFTAPAGVSCNGPVNVQCTGLALNGGENATINLMVKVSSTTGTYNNNVSVTSAEGPTATDDGAIADSDTLNSVDGLEADPATDEDVIVSNLQADVAITKTVKPAAAGPNTSLTYTIDVVNNGPSTASSVVVNDALPAEVTFASTSLAQTSGPNPLVWNLGDLAPGATRAFTVTVTVKSNTLNGFSNTATVSTTTSDTDPSNNSSTIPVTVTNTDIDLGIVKDDGAGTYTPGSPVNYYTITVHNYGPNDAIGATVTDSLPAGITAWTWTCFSDPTGTCTPSAAGSTSNFSDTIDLTAGQEIVYHVVASTDPSYTGDLTNIAAVSAPASLTDIVPGNDSDNDIDKPVIQADVEISKMVSSATAGPNDTLTYTLRVDNNGPSTAVNVQVSDTIPAGFTFSSANPAASSSTGSTLTWNLGDKRPGTKQYIDVTVTVNPDTLSGTITNTATVSTTTTETSTTNNTASVDVTVTNNNIDLGIVKDDGAATYKPGQPVTYTITVHNYGPNAASGATVSDSLPAGITSWTWTCASDPTGTCTGGTAAPFADTITLAAGQEIVYSVTAVTNPAYTGNIDNIASVTAPAGLTDTVPGNNSDNDLDTPVSDADVAITKTVSSATAGPNDSLTYTLAVVNNGPSTAAAVAVSDTIPAGLSFNSATPAASSSTGASYTWNLGDLMPGEKRTITVNVTVDPATLSGTLSNTAAVSTTTTETITTNNTSTVPVTVTNTTIDLGIVKDDGTSTYNPGQTVTYTITVHNYGPNDVTGATVSDALPTGALSWTWSCAIDPTGTCSGGTAVPFADTINLAAGQDIVYTVAMVTDPATTGSLDNTATVTVPNGLSETNTGNNSDNDLDTPLVQADVLIIKMASPFTVGPNASVTYTLRVINSGPATAANVVVSDTIPAGLTFSSATPAAASNTGETYTWNLGAVAPGVPQDINITVKVNAGTLSGTITNSATVSTSTPETNTNNNTSSADITVANNTIDLGIVKDDGAATYTPGQTVNYVITVHNYGPNAAAGATVNDPMPAGILNWTWTCDPTSNGTCTPSAVNSTAPFSDTVDLAAGEEIIYHVAASTDPIYTGNLDNTAMVNPPVGLVDSVPSNDIDNDLDTPVPQADVTITKTVSSATAGPNDTLAYTLLVVNNGPSIAANVTVSDTIPAGLTVTGTSPFATSVTGSTYNWNLGSMVPGVPQTITVNVTVNPNTLSGTITNTATVTTSTPETNTNNNTSSILVTVTNNNIDLGILKDDGLASFTPGQTVTYTIRVHNYGPNDVTGATVSDALPTGALSWTWTCTTDPTGTCSGGTAVPFADTINLAVGQEIVYTVDMVTGATYTGSLDNTAVVTPPNGLIDTDMQNNTSQDIDTPVPPADVAINKAVQPAAAGPGTPLTYTLTVTNLGAGPATNVVVSDSLPAGVTFVANSATPAQTSGPNPLTWNLGTLASGDTQTITFQVTVNPATLSGTITNTASVTTTSQETNTNNNTSSVTVTVTNTNIDLGITKDDGVTTYTPGNTLTYTITLVNNGPNDAAGATISDLLPAGILRWTWACTSDPSGTCDGVSGSAADFSDTIDLAVGETMVYTVTAVTDPSYVNGTLDNTAVVAPPNGLTDTNPANDQDSDSDTRVPVVDLALTKDVSPKEFLPGDLLTYTLTVTNNGPSTAINTIASDTLPVEVAYVSAAPAPATTPTAPARTYTWALGDLLPGQTRVITLRVTVYDWVTEGFTNTATVDSDTSEPVTTNNVSSVLIPPTPVELIYFRAIRVSDEQVSVQWATETEVNTFGYRLMRATTRDFSQAVEMGFAPVDVVNKKYEALDAVPGQGVYWYWLVKIDNNGHEETSDPVMVLNYPASKLNFLYLPASGR